MQHLSAKAFEFFYQSCIFFCLSICTKIKKCIFAHPFGWTVVWCNGSTTGFGPVSRGSNPCTTTQLESNLLTINKLLFYCVTKFPYSPPLTSKAMIIC